MLKEFKEFILRGNAMEMSVGIIIGAAFTAIVNSIVNNLIDPLIGAVTNGTDFSALTFKIGEATIRYGSFLNDIINFILTGFVVFLIVKAVNRLSTKKEEEVAEPSELELLTEIRDNLKKQNKAR